MIIKELKPNVKIYSLKAETESEKQDCLWAKFTFDCDSGTLNIASDAGTFTYSLGYNEHEDFMSLMSRINEFYLLAKISNQAFDIVESKKSMIKTIKKCAIMNKWCKNGKEVANVVSQIKDIPFLTEEAYIYFIRGLLKDNFDYEDIEVKKDYPLRAKIIANLFVKWIQPQIKLNIKK